MATIDIQTDGSLLIVSVTGILLAEEVIEIINGYYTNSAIKDVVWDLTNGSMHLMSHEGFREIARTTKKIVDDGFRKGGKTAYIGNSDHKFGLLSMYTVIAEITGVAAKYKVFNSMEEAKTWL